MIVACKCDVIKEVTEGLSGRLRAGHHRGRRSPRMSAIGIEGLPALKQTGALEWRSPGFCQIQDFCCYGVGGFSSGCGKPWFLVVHGDQMVPMPRFTTVKGPLTELLGARPSAHHREDEERRGRNSQPFENPQRLLCTCSLFRADGKAILFDEKRLLPCSRILMAIWCCRHFCRRPVVLGERH